MFTPAESYKTRLKHLALPATIGIWKWGTPSAESSGCKYEPCLCSLGTLLAALGDVWDPHQEAYKIASQRQRKRLTEEMNTHRGYPSIMQLLPRESYEDIKKVQRRAVSTLEAAAPPELVEYAINIYTDRYDL